MGERWEEWMTFEHPRSVRVASTLFAAAAGVGALTIVVLLLCFRTLASAQDNLFAVAGSGDEVVHTVEMVGSDLRYQIVVAAATSLVAVALAGAVRRTWPAARIIALMSALAVGLAWACGVALSTETRIQRQPGEPPAVRDAYEALLPAWYPVVMSLATAATLGLLIAAAVALLRSSAAEYYRREARVLATYVPRPDAGGPTPD
jgi:hypothetical protein